MTHSIVGLAGNTDKAPSFEPNRGKNIDKALVVGLVVTYPLIIWFGWIVLNYAPSLVAFTAIWIVGILFWSRFPYEVEGVTMVSDGMSVSYRKGAKDFRYQSVVRIWWGKDFAGGGLNIWLNNGDIVILGGMDKRLADRILAVLMEKRSELRPEQSHQGPTSLSWGVLVDDKYRGRDWRMNFIWHAGYDRCFWGLSREQKLA